MRIIVYVKLEIKLGGCAPGRPIFLDRNNRLCKNEHVPTYVVSNQDFENLKFCVILSGSLSGIYYSKKRLKRQSFVLGGSLHIAKTEKASKKIYKYPSKSQK